MRAGHRRCGRRLAPAFVPLLALFLAACAPLPPEVRRDRVRPVAVPTLPAQHEVPSWRLSELLATDAAAVGFRSDRRLVAVLPLANLRAMARAAERTTWAANHEAPITDPEFRVLAGDDANAFAIVGAGGVTVAVNFGMVTLLGEDEHMWAAVIGHELAHLKRQHQLVRSERSERAENLSSLASVLLSLVGVPFAPVLADATAGMLRLSYSRDDELEADALAVSYLRAAGYDPQAALRFHERLAAQTAESSGGLLSTHPGGSERIEAIRRQLEERPAR